MSSAGLSIKDIMDGAHNDDSLHNTGTLQRNFEEANRNDCFYGVCRKFTYFNGYVVCGRFKSRKNQIFCLFLTVMCTALFISIILPLLIYKLADDGINEEVVIDSTSAKNYNIWQTNTVGKGFEDYKVHYDLYFFDIQNPEETLQGQKPVVVELGPYAYNEYFYRFDIRWTDDGDTVTFYNQRFYVFDQSRTGPGLTQSDEITLPYPTVSGFQHILESVPVNVSTLVEVAIDSVLLESEQKITDALTTVYDEVEAAIAPRNPNNAKLALLAQEVVRLNASVKALYEQVFRFTAQSNPLDLFFKTMMCNTDNGISPFFKGQPSPAWFGWMNDSLLLEVNKVLLLAEAQSPGLVIPWTNAVPGITVNYTSQKDLRRRKMPETFKTGKRNSAQVGQYVRYNNMRSMWNCILPMNSQDPSEYREGFEAPACRHWDDSWNDSTAAQMGYVQPFTSPYSNRIQGTDGNMFGRPIRTNKLQIFSYDIYRSGFMVYKGDVTDWHGVRLRRFGIQPKDMYNSTLNPGNAEYYANGISGVENLTQALNLPVFASFPHFLYGDKRLVEDVVGLHPDEETHTSRVDLEPQTGLIARATKRIQVNYLMRSTHLPEAANDTLETVDTLCHEFQTILNHMANDSVPTNVSISCNLTIATPLMTCLAAPSEWRMRGGEVYMPYGWVQEGIVMPESSATQLNDSLFLMNDLASQVRFWCLIVAGICLAALMAMVWDSHNTEQWLEEQESVLEGKYRSSMVGGNEPLLSSSPSVNSLSSSVGGPAGWERGRLAEEI